MSEKMDDFGDDDLHEPGDRLPAVKIERESDGRVGRPEKPVSGMAEEKREMAFIFGGVNDHPLLAQGLQLFHLLGVDGDPRKEELQNDRREKTRFVGKITGVVVKGVLKQGFKKMADFLEYLSCHRMRSAFFTGSLFSKDTSCFRMAW
jgi:hypothetical protein